MWYSFWQILTWQRHLVAKRSWIIYQLVSVVPNELAWYHHMGELVHSLGKLLLCAKSSGRIRFEDKKGEIQCFSVLTCMPWCWRSFRKSKETRDILLGIYQKLLNIFIENTGSSEAWYNNIHNKREYLDWYDLFKTYKYTLSLINPRSQLKR